MSMEVNSNYNSYPANYNYAGKTEDAAETVKAADNTKETGTKAADKNNAKEIGTKAADKDSAKEIEAKAANKDDAKELGVLVEISKDSKEAQRIAEFVRNFTQGGIRMISPDAQHRYMYGNVSSEVASPATSDSERFKEMEEFGRQMIPKLREDLLHGMVKYREHKLAGKELSTLKSGVILNDDNYYSAMISNRMPSTYGEKNADGEYERSYYSVNEEADNLLKAYADAYDEIQRGYADGTRIAYVQDEKSETGYRRLTKEEEIEKLNKAYEKQVNFFERRNDPRIAAALEENAKKIEKIKSSGNKGVTSDSLEELEKRRAELEKLPKNPGRNLLDAANLFAERYQMQKPGMANVSDILSGISIFGK